MRRSISRSKSARDVTTVMSGGSLFPFATFPTHPWPSYQEGYRLEMQESAKVSRAKVSGRRVRGPVRKERLGHPLQRQLILEGRRLRPVPGVDQPLNLSGVFSSDGAPGGLIARPAESH